jgi:hypothetical protein
MALSKIQAESMNLADTYAFTGTVSGASDMVKIATTTVTTDVSSVDFENLSTDYNNFCVHIAEPIPSSNNNGLVLRFKLNGSYQSGSDSYTNSRQRIYQSGGASWTDSANGFLNTYGGLHLGQNSSGNGYVESGANIIVWFHNVHSSLGHSYNAISWGTTDSQNSSANQISATYVGSNRLNPIQGIRFFYNSGNVASGRFTLYGVKT